MPLEELRQDYALLGLVYSHFYDIMTIIGVSCEKNWKKNFNGGVKIKVQVRSRAFLHKQLPYEFEIGCSKTIR